jgi:hypothetical protein
VSGNDDISWDDEVSGNDDISWDERAMLDVVMGETSIAAPGIGTFRGALPEWSEADIVDSMWFENAPSFYPDVASFDAHDDDTSRYPDDAHDDDDALEDYLNAFFDEVNRSAIEY